MAINLDVFDDNAKNLEILVEECAEVIQIKSKIYRFGLDFKHPVTGRLTKDDFIQEIGDVFAMVDILINDGMFNMDDINKAKIKKIEKLVNWY